MSAERAVETLVLTGSEIDRCLTPRECREALADAFRALAAGSVGRPQALGFEAEGGGFHVKSCLSLGDPPRFVAKVNGNFPGNPARHGLPVIQGVLVLADARDGRPIAILDSARVTAIRTAATSALAASLLSPAGETELAIVGCGRQGAEHLDAFLDLRPLAEVRLFDLDRTRAEGLAARCRERGGPSCRVFDSAAESVRGAGLVATCTTGRDFVLAAGDVSPGAFVAGVGTDYPGKRELHPSLLAAARVVVDDLDPCAAGGDLHHAIEAGVMRREDVRAELAQVAAGTVAVREHEGEIVVFDSTGIALEDLAAADRVWARAVALGIGRRVALAA